MEEELSEFSSKSRTLPRRLGTQKQDKINQQNEREYNSLPRSKILKVIQTTKKKTLTGPI